MAVNILLIDDDADVREMVRMLLRAKGYTIHETGNGRIGFDMIEEIKPDLIILDLMLPGMSGLEVLKHLHANAQYKNIPVIVFSAVGDNAKRPNDFWRQGLKVDEFISKADFRAEEMLGHVAYLLNRDSYRSAQPLRPLPAVEPESEKNTPDEEPSVDLSQASPQDVVRYFLEAWNDQNFGVEFDCLGGKMTPAMNREDFILRRKTRSEEPGEQDRKQYLKEVLDVQNDEITATVKIRREDQRQGKSALRVETYFLQNTSSGWRIIHVKISNTQ